MPTDLRETLRLNCLLAAILIATGGLSLLIASPPGYIVPLFPPTGIALAAVLAFGNRAGWGVYVAVAVIQVLAQWHTGLEDLYIGSLLLGSLAPTLQALVGAWLMRRMRIWPSGLDSIRSVTLFVCIAAPISCLVSATAAIPLLLAAHVSNESLTLGNWFIWWTGDVLGILLFTPISLAVIGKPASDWRGRKRSVALPLLICAIILAGVLVFVRQREDARIADEFQHNAEHEASTLAARLSAHMDMIMTVERFAAINRNLSREGWTRVTAPWLQRYPGTQNLTWDPFIRHATRSDFERDMQAKGLIGYRIVDRNTNGQILAAATHAEYLPIAYIEPLSGNEQALGVNVLSLPAAVQAIERSRSTGHAAATQAVRLVQTPNSQQSVVVYQAVFAKDNNPDSALLGVVSMALQLDGVIFSTRNTKTSLPMDTCLVDLTAHSQTRHLYGPPGCENPEWLTKHLSLFRQIPFAGREWQILLRTTEPYSMISRGWATNAALATALCFAGMLSAFLLLITGRTRRIEEQVTQRTAELASATAQLRDQKASLAQAQRIARMGSWEISGGSNHLRCSDEFRRLLGLPATGRIMLDDVLIRLWLDDRTRLANVIHEASLSPVSRTLDCSTLADGNEQQVLHFQIESEWSLGRLLRIHGTAQNVTTTRQAEAHIQYLARFDPLTNLPNRTHWQELARSALSAAQRHGDKAALLFLDLDHFKTINDSLGHNVGDELLSQVAGRLRDSLRSEDILGRQGGDEFVLLLPRLRGPDEVGAVSAKLVQALADPVHLREHELSVSVSIGIAYYPSDGEDIDTLLKHADVAMYSAKQAGRNNFKFFIPSMNLRAMDRLRMESSLRRALERGELILHYQPQLDLPSGLVNACEALVRWRHPENGLVPPSDFIPLAEESGLILPLGDWVIREACMQQTRWAKDGLDITMAINISALQFRQPDFVDKVCAIISATGTNPQRIELEITESALLGSTEQLVASLERLREMGVCLALDDFGTGYSCLSYLKRLPIERLKIDQSFVKDLPGNIEDAAIALATISMARDLGMDVVAEGVETEAQQNYLAAHNCRTIQGYLISRPLPADKLFPWLTTHARQRAST